MRPSSLLLLLQKRIEHFMLPLLTMEKTVCVACRVVALHANGGRLRVGCCLPVLLIAQPHRAENSTEPLTQNTHSTHTKPPQHAARRREPRLYVLAGADY